MKQRSLLPFALAALSTACGPAPEASSPQPEVTAVAPPPPIPPPSTPPAAEAPRPVPVADPSLIPRATFSGNPDYISPALSPDGTQISWVAPSNGVLNVYVAPFGAIDKARAVTASKDRPVRDHQWAHDKAHILYLQDSGGDENYHLFAADLKTGATRDLTPYSKVRVEKFVLSPKRPKEVAVQINDRDPQVFDVHRIEIATGKRSLVFENKDSYTDLVTDDDFDVRVLEKPTPDGGKELFHRDKKGTLTSLGKLTLEDGESDVSRAIDASGKTLYMADPRGRDTAAAVAVDLATGKTTLLAEDARADLTGMLLDPRTHAPQAAAFDYERIEWKAIDKTIEADLAALKAASKGAPFVVSRSLDDKRWIVADLVDDGPVPFSTYDRKTKALSFLFVHRKKLSGLPLAKMLPRVIRARDGLPLVAYLSLPKGSDPDGDGKPTKALPMVLVVHGGPWARDSWGYNGWHQWLANRGYAVLSVNYRGSTGFGKKFVNAANGEWGRKMHDDLIDTVEWAVQLDIAQRDRVAIFGGSYGGYAALVGATFTPAVFACAVDLVGISNLVTFVNSFPPYWKPYLDQVAKRLGGDARTEEGRKFLLQRSPITFVDQIKKPLLIGQGANDPRVKKAESDQIVASMQQKKIPVTYILFPDEGHGFARPENRMSFDAIAEAFLAQHLGGKYQPIDKDFTGSSIQVEAGAGDVIGLSAAKK